MTQSTLACAARRRLQLRGDIRAAFDVRTVASLAATGNEPVPGIIDAAGNANGLVCAKPLSDAAAAQLCRQVGGCTSTTLYYIRDDVAR